ncbi:hypothetical protein Y1Q_0015030 [Alligator mississippiensis]|uniref:Uncharacterized protein n=1 Tax=Alligator mississippiensis TaxID=8496 RepID=A0A151N8W4_ALLMI|nr:hypothetical protein Y1Q_0015030 [Alligator mississippiensis]
MAILPGCCKDSAGPVRCAALRSGGSSSPPPGAYLDREKLGWKNQLWFKPFMGLSALQVLLMDDFILSTPCCEAHFFPNCSFTCGCTPLGIEKSRV